MNAIDILKKTVKVVVAAGTAKIVNDFIKNNVDTESTLNKVTVTTASVAIGGAVGEITGNYTDHQIDELFDLFKKIKNGKNAPESED
jgi:hypothetical protein